MEGWELGVRNDELCVWSRERVVMGLALTAGFFQNGKKNVSEMIL